MHEIPVKIVLRGDRTAANGWRRDAMRVMGILENLMSFRDLKQCKLQRVLAPGVVVVAEKQFGLRTLTIYASGGGDFEAHWLADCFANITCALAYIVGVTPVMPFNSQGEVVQIADLEKPTPCGDPRLYPAEVYGTRYILYDVAVCDGDGEYVLYKNIFSSDATPRCPGEMVLVMQNRTTDLPEGVLEGARNNPMVKNPFTYKIRAFEKSITILPYIPDMEKRREYQV